MVVLCCVCMLFMHYVVSVLVYLVVSVLGTLCLRCLWSRTILHSVVGRTHEVHKLCCAICVFVIHFYVMIYIFIDQ